MEEIREQPIIMPATALNPAEEEKKEINEESAMSEVGSLNQGDLGKFKSVQALMDAYNNLQAEFTKKCQVLSELKKDKTEEMAKENFDHEEKTEVSTEETNVSPEDLTEEKFNQFLSENSEAQEYAEEIKEKISSQKNSSPYEVAWAKVILGKLKEENENSDKIINQYVLSNENVKNKIIENYLKELSNSKSPLVISSQSGERVSGVMPDTPKTLKDAKKLVNKMFS